MSVVLSDDERKLLTAFNKHSVRFIVVGLTSAVLQGSYVVTQDIDLWLENLGADNFIQAIQSAGGFYVPPGVAGANPPLIGPAALRVFDIVTTPQGLDDFESEYKRSLVVQVDGVELHILPLDRIILSKETANREKDRAVLPALRASAASKK